MSGEKTGKLDISLQNCFKQWEVEILHMLTRLSYNLIKLKHQTGIKNWAEALRKFPAANTALHLVLTKKSELNLNDKNVFPQVWIDVF